MFSIRWFYRYAISILVKNNKFIINNNMDQLGNSITIYINNYEQRLKYFRDNLPMKIGFNVVNNSDINHQRFLIVKIIT